jgi:hypothetical protein
MMLKRLTTCGLCLCLCLGLVTACGGNGDGDGETEPADALGAAAETVIGAGKEALAEFTEEYSEQLDNYESRIEALQAAAKKVSDDRLNEIITSMDAKLGDAREKLSELSSADEGTMMRLKAEIMKLVDDMKLLYKEAAPLATSAGGESMPEVPKLPGG